MASIVEILRNPLSVRKTQYGSSDISKLVIDGNVFTGYKTFSSFWEKTYAKQPERSASGVISNLNDYSTFNTFIVKVNFAMMSIDDYRRLYELFLLKNEFVVTAYDVLTNKPYTCKMYFAPDQMPKLYMMARKLQGDKFVEILGVQDYTIELIGTNADLDEVSIIYQDGGGNRLGSTTSYENSQYIVGQDIIVSDYNGYPFSGEWERVGSSGTILNNSQANVVLLTQSEQNSRTIIWKAKYDTTKVRTLSFSYGLGTPLKDDKGNDINSIKFQPNVDTIGSAISNSNIILQTGGNFSALPISPNPVFKQDANYITHTNKGWRLGNSIAYSQVDNSTPLTIDNNIIIYQVFEPVKHSVTFESNGGTTYNKLVDIPYEQMIALPNPYKANSVFGGWFLDSKLTKSFNGVMLPYDITLYAKWS